MLSSHYPPTFALNTKLLTFFWKSKHSPAAPFHSIYLLFLGLCDTLGMTNASRLIPWVVNCHISDSLSLLLMLLRHHSWGLVRKHTLISPVYALSDAQSMNQWPSFHEKNPMRPHFMCEIGEGGDSAVSQSRGGPFMQFTRHKPDPGEQTCHIQVSEYNASDLFLERWKDMLFKVRLI